ncbi:membrane protein [Luteitalea sp. TBR-22]|uniref:OmpA family protein n=1 Tax=Luteitalea sp. TBR-22 TaxID=2802971 RepID=UPI001AFA6CDC|nr:OmpA family protein [Luteitalea sp. TBR-22]BCS31736.1 membrane protein [Luteitalea sp. TBR-22]
MTSSSLRSPLLAIGLLCGLPVLAAAQAPPDADVKDCKDHPLFTRMADTHIVSCRAVEFDRFAFRTGKGVETPVEGRKFEVRYKIATGKASPGPLAIIRNHQQAIARIGGTTKYEDARYTTLQVTAQGQEVWTQVDTAWGGGYMLTIIEKQAMTQQVVASAEAFKAGLATSGHVEVPGIFFDTGQAVLKPESTAAVAEVASLLKASPALKVFVVGHTDNVASLDLNTKLSQARADAVVQALVSTHGIAASRLVARGVGPLAPVASNDAEDGRAKNRRVELVKQ